eukprot:CAMPEP_0118631704 /NCGR_PEP_ID=MMETSP0785-20121206/46_1 /TAXON_ID=91992 /ORGANISM="Bolidomonas pacifica, Strain CCMP 1866" /LENGTH=316 /DNA_ID=CAMNT_0006522411 /DNA_START=72 /DNA_END=1019 /DNA_ORIENTATION=+
MPSLPSPHAFFKQCFEGFKDGLLWATLGMGLCTVPLTLTFYPSVYAYVYSTTDPYSVPNWMGLVTGLFSVLVSQMIVCLYGYFKGLVGEQVKEGGEGKRNSRVWHMLPVQKKEYKGEILGYKEALFAHLTNPEGFLLLGGYLIIYWMSGMMNESYYNMKPVVPSVRNVFGQLALVDFLQYAAHRLEHIAPTWIYVASHKPHHRHHNPNLFQAFDGSVADTVLMILVPLLGTSVIMGELGAKVTVWEYMTFGSLYSSHLCLIHSNTPHRFDLLHRLVGVGTSWDHHVHHSMFKYNYGHLFMWWDWVGGTYRDGGEKF